MWFKGVDASPAVTSLAASVRSLREELATERAARGFAMQRMGELRLEHAREVAELQRQLHVCQANFEWLSVSHNKLSADNAALLSARYGVNVSPISIETRPPMMDTPSGFEPSREARRERSGMAESVDAVGLFDDVGEIAARAQGLDNTEVYNAGEILTRG